MNVQMQEIADLISDNNDPDNFYELLDVLGQGSYGSVFKALHKQTGKLYAIKILPATSGIEISSVKKQVAILKQCDDDHVVRYYGSYYKQNNLWIVMEFCVAGSVTDIIQITKKKFNQYEIASILESTLKGLQYIHARKKIHRDIKAANILLDQKGNAKLADFGVSASSMYTNARFRTHIGSPYWMSPQIIKYSEYDQKTDIWSLGITAIELAEGQVPNSHIKPFMVIFMTKSNPVQGFKEPTLWSQQFNNFVKQCLNISPTHRPQAKQLLDHPFITKYSKGQRLLSELVLNSLQQIEQFRMNQSRNSSFAQIIIEEGRGSGETKTIVQKGGSKNNTVKSHSSLSENNNSMVIVQQSNKQSSHLHSQSNAESMIINDNSMIMNNETISTGEHQQNYNILTNYINELKVNQTAEAKCIQMLEKTINGYDEKLEKQIESLFKDYKERASNDIKYLQQLQQKQKQKSNNSEDIFAEVVMSKWKCRLLGSMNVRQFLGISEVGSSEVGSEPNFNKSNNNINFYKDPNLLILKHNQSIEEKETETTFNFHNVRKESKSFLVSKEKAFEKQQETVVKQLEPAAKAQSHNSSRIILRAQETPIPASKKIQQFKDDPDVLQYLQKNFPQTHQLGQLHCKSYTPNYTGSKIHTQISTQQQKSTEHSLSRGKNKTLKSSNTISNTNTKVKKQKMKSGS